MKPFRHTFLLTILATLTVACSSDNETTETPGPGQPAESAAPVTVGLRIAAAGGGDTRAWQDGNATNDEMMNLWTVVVADASSGKVQAIHACKPTGEAKPEVDDYVDLTPGTYKFYSFANMAPSVVMQLLGISGTGKTGSEVTRAGDDNGDGSGGNDNGSGDNDNPTQGNDPTTGNEPGNPDKSRSDDISSKQDNTVYAITFDTGATITATPDEVKARVDGNGFDPTASSNGFGAKGIPMSNVQTKTITSTTTFDLIVVRMMAKIELQIENKTGESVTVKSVTLSNLTQNANGNLKLLPSLTQHDKMDPTHQDIKPNLGAASQGDYTYTLPIDKQPIAKDETQTVSFYVNESATPTNLEHLFYLTLELDNGGSSEFRYALISDNTANEWNYIARNDYRIIPITLDNLKFEIIPYDFPPIGVYPCSVKEVDAANHVYDFEFHDYGHFHLLPSVTKGGTPVEFATESTLGTDAYKWMLVDDDFSKSWFTYAAFGDAAQTANPGDFYRSPAVYLAGYDASNPIDGDELGGEPVWYTNDFADSDVRPKWDPQLGITTPTTYRPFIFGYIDEAAGEKRVYHEMKIQIYNGSSVYRQMLYRFYMTLSDSQMLSPALRATTPRRQH